MIDFLMNLAAWIFIFLFSSGTLIGIAFWFFKLFGEKWLSNKFAERLEAFKHYQQKEIEHLRFEINKLFDRTTKLHQREFETLPRAWSLLAKSFHTVKGFISPLQSYPDVARMNETQLDNFLVACPLDNWEKEQLKSSSDKNKYYQDTIFWHHIRGARKSCRKAALYLLRNGIFMPPELKDKFKKLEDIIWDALTEHQINKEHDLKPRERTAHDRFSKEGESLIKDLETSVQGRLRDTVSEQK